VTHPGHHGHRPADVFRDERFAAMIEVEGELAAGLTDRAVTRCIELLGGRPGDVRRIADLGCGPGVATSRLAQTFGSAVVVGVDGSPVMLARAGERAARCGVADRVDLRQLDLDGDLTPLGAFDLVWAALALHHTADQRAALGRFGALLRSRGLLCLLERADPMALRPANELGRPGIWDRVESARPPERATVVDLTPASGDAGAFAPAGLELLHAGRITDVVTAPPGPAVPRLIGGYVGAVLHTLGDHLDPADREALGGAAGHARDIEWGEVRVTSGRLLLVARPRRSGRRR
jgi:SAM-dependent methyltransferase